MIVSKIWCFFLIFVWFSILVVAWKCIESSPIIGKMLKLTAEVSVVDPINVSFDPEPDTLKHWIKIQINLTMNCRKRRTLTLFLFKTIKRKYKKNLFRIYLDIFMDTYYTILWKRCDQFYFNFFWPGSGSAFIKFGWFCFLWVILRL